MDPLSNEITLDQLALVVEGLKQLYFNWCDAEDDLDIQSLSVGYMAAHEGITYEQASSAYKEHIEPMMDGWDEEYDTLTASETEPQEEEELSF